MKEANAQLFLKQFETVAFHDSESVDEFAVRICGLVGKLHALGEKVEEGRVVKKILLVLPPRYNQIACSIEMLLDLNKLSVEELVGRLRVAEDRCGMEAAADGVERLLLTEEQWEAHRRQHSKDRARGGDGWRGSSEKGGGRRGGHDDTDDSSSTSSGFSRHAGSRYRG